MALEVPEHRPHVDRVASTTGLPAETGDAGRGGLAGASHRPRPDIGPPPRMDAPTAHRWSLSPDPGPALAGAGRAACIGSWASTARRSDRPPTESRAELDRLRGEVAALRQAVRRLSAQVAEHNDLASTINSIVLRWDPEGRIRYLNVYGQDFFGYTLNEVLGCSVVGTIVPETETTGRDLARLMHEILRHPGRYLSNENENMRRDGKRVWITWRNRPVLDEAGRLREIVSTGIDTTTRRRAEEALRESERRYRVLFQSTPVALLERDASALKAYLDDLVAAGRDVDAVAGDPYALAGCLAMIRTTDWNAAVLDMLEARDDQAQVAVDALAEAVGVACAGPEILRAVAAGRVASLEREMSLVTLRGNPRTVALHATIVPGHEESSSRILIAGVDITARKQAEDVLRASAHNFQFLAIHDTHTGLYNTRYLYEALERLVGESRVRGEPLAVVFMDLDRFKRVVDRHGHLSGSRVIQEVAWTIRAALPEGAFAVAYAGDEFVVVLPGFGRDAAVVTAETIRTCVAHSVYLAAAGQRVSLTMSVGVATLPDDAHDLAELLAAADRALFAAKRAGRNAVATPAPGERSNRRRATRTGHGVR
jgi:diguanylate cyclase (GGDEF)-like protein/PAS domain S-box-containing protein